jgi:hypothetical protein
MKKIFFSLTLLIAIFLVSNVANAQKTKELNKYGQMLVGTWYVDSIDVDLSKLAPEYQAIVKQQFNEKAKGTHVIISADRKYKAVGASNMDGLWGISDDGKILTIKPFDETKKVEKTKITFLSDDKIVMQKVDDTSNSNKMYLHKAKE